MADVIPIGGAQPGAPMPPGLPDPAANQLEARQSKDAGEVLAKEAAEFHRRGLDARRRRDLTAEKYLMHVDGEGLSQWLDVIGGTRLRMTPSLLNVPKAQNNQLRPILDNFVSHLTSRSFQLVVEPKPDRKGRESAAIDQAIINADVRRMNWNALWAEAKYMAACAGFCPVHAAVRDTPDHTYEAVLATQAGPQGQQVPMQGPSAITVDGWCGNPFDTVLNAGSRRNSLHRATYGRVLPAALVSQAFGREVKGSERIPSSSTFQRIAQKWAGVSGYQHNTASLSSGRGHEELVGLIYEEVIPGVDPEWPDGRLTILALEGLATSDRTEARGSAGKTVHLWTGPLPARRFSFTLVYSHHRFDDVHGKPYIADMDDDQIQVNQLETMYNKFIQKATSAPLASSGKVEVDTIGPLGDTILQVEPLMQGGTVELQYLQQPDRHMQYLDAKINRVIEGMYRKAGWQAASRGEMQGSGKAIIALQQADDSIFGPISQRTAEEVEAYADLVWALRKDFMDVPMVLDEVGDELAHLAQPYVDRTMMSERPPIFTLVSGFGASTEAKAQQLLNMFGMVDAKGEQLIGTREIRKLWPDNSLFPDREDPQEARERRPKVVNALIRAECKKITEQLQAQYPEWQPSMADPLTAQAGEYVAMTVDGLEPAMQDDDLAVNIETLSLITQDPTEHPCARRAAMVRQGQYWQWLAMQQMAQQAQMATQQATGQAAKEGVKDEAAQRRGQAPRGRGARVSQSEGGTPTAQSMVNSDKQFERQIA